MDVYQMVTDRIIAMLGQGKIPWERPWTGSGNQAIRHISGEPYSLLNQMLLNRPGEYVTFKQCEAEGGKVKKGAKSQIVVFWKWLQYTQPDGNGGIIRDGDGNPIYKEIPLLRYYNVFHIDDCDGIKPKYDAGGQREFDPIEKAEGVIDDYVSRSGVKMEYSDVGGAYYSPLLDRVHLPLKEQFKGVSEFYSTAFHELTHSTGHSSRLDRFTDGSFNFGSETYSKEELVAEIGSASILSMLGIETDKSVRNNAAYIQSWLQALKNDKKLIVTASGKAQKAVELILPLDNGLCADYNVA